MYIYDISHVCHEEPKQYRYRKKQITNVKLHFVFNVKFN